MYSEKSGRLFFASHAAQGEKNFIESVEKSTTREF